MLIVTDYSLWRCVFKMQSSCYSVQLISHSVEYLCLLLCLGSGHESQKHVVIAVYYHQGPNFILFSVLLVFIKATLDFLVHLAAVLSAHLLFHTVVSYLSAFSVEFHTQLHSEPC